MSRSRRPARPLLLIGLLAATLGIAAGLLLRGSEGSAQADPLAAGYGSPEIRVVLVPSADREPIFATVWEGDELLWYLSAGGADKAVLNRVRRDGSGQQSWQVPLPMPPTAHAYIARDPKGNLWLGAGYGLAAFDPGTSAWVAAVTLEPQDELMSPDALDPQGASPGT